MGFSWTKESAIAELNTLINEIDDLTRRPRASAEFVRWFVKCTTLLRDVFGDDSVYAQFFSQFTWSEPNPFPIIFRTGLDNPQQILERVHQAGYIKQLGGAKGLLQAATGELSRVEKIDDVYQGKNTAPESSMILKIISLAEPKLRKVFRNPPRDEKEVQHAFESLLIGADIPYSKETESIEYSTKTYEPDFTVDKISLAIEIKLCTSTDREKKIIDEINADIPAYRKKYENLVFVIYDLGFIRDVERFAAEFEKAGSDIFVRVVKQ